MWMACYGQQIATAVGYSAAAIREASFAGRGGAVMALGAVDLSFWGEVWGRILGCRCSRRARSYPPHRCWVKITKRKLAFFRGRW